jgi:short-chain fatty acids transporter
MVSWAQWSLGLIVGAILAKGVATSCRQRNIRVHFPLLVAAAYTGFLPYHMGYSGAAPLTAATPGSFIEEFLGAPVSVTETVFSWWNMLGLAIMIPALVVGMVMCRPKSPAEIVEIPVEDEAGPASSAVLQKPANPAEWIESKRYLTLGLGALLGAFVIGHFMRLGFVLTFDIVNWSMLTIILLLVSSPAELSSLIKNAATVTGEVLLQYPLYAGILGIVTTTGLIEVLSDAFIANSDAATLPLIAFLAAGLVNIFVPSGGGQFAIQGPIFIEAGNALGTDPALIIMAIGYGDSWTNMIQPFFALPILAIAGLGVRSILKYTVVSLLISGLVFGVVLALGSYLGQ